jgi:hypothetical protein
MKEFAEAYKKAKTWEDADKALDHLSFDELRNLVRSLEVVKEAMGLDMRQDFYLGIMKSRVKFHYAQLESV